MEKTATESLIGSLAQALLKRAQVVIAFRQLDTHLFCTSNYLKKYRKKRQQQKE
jgi:hypothetical protein